MKELIKQKNKIMGKYLFLLLLFSSCTVPESMEGPINNTGTIITPGNGSTIPPINLIGQTWRINHYRVGEMGQMIVTSDILKFTSNTSYKFNGYPSTYSLTPTGSGYNLTLNETLWGNLSGSILTNNLVSGNIPGIPFQNIASGSSNSVKYYLWIVKL
jgi:hypothetical protein